MDNRRDFQKEADAYFLALGKFIHEFSQLEARLQYLLWTTTGVDEATAKAIFSGTRIDGCTNFIRRLREAKGAPPCDYLDKAFSQIPIITMLRNDIVHYGAEFSGDEFVPVVSTERAHQEGKIRFTKAPATALDNAREDIRTIIACFNQHQLQQFTSSTWGTPVWKHAADRAWLYKPEAPSDHLKQSRGSIRKPPSRPK